MTQKDKLLSLIEDKFNNIKERLESYKKVDATLSCDTLFRTAMYLEMADNALESGFVNDACEEIETLISYN